MAHKLWDEFELMEIGTPDSLDYRRLFIDSEGMEVSLWRDSSLYSGKFLNCICKTPMGSCSSYIIDVTEDNPSFKLALNQNNQVVSYTSPAPWNIGFLPQTWADPEQSSLEHFWGLNDGQPVEVIEMSTNVLIHNFGSVSVVKPLAVFLVVNDVHTSVGILAINARDYMAKKMNNGKDIETYMPGTLTQVYDWLQNRNETQERVLILGDNQPCAIEDMYSLIEKAHLSWKLFSEVHLEWSQRALETFNYGVLFWESYIAYDSKIKCSNAQKSKSRELYDFAWASVKEEEDELKRTCSFAFDSKDKNMPRSKRSQPLGRKKGSIRSSKVQNSSMDSLEYCEKEDSNNDSSCLFGLLFSKLKGKVKKK